MSLQVFPWDWEWFFFLPRRSERVPTERRERHISQQCLGATLKKELPKVLHCYWIYIVGGYMYTSGTYLFWAFLKPTRLLYGLPQFVQFIKVIKTTRDQKSSSQPLFFRAPLLNCHLASWYVPCPTYLQCRPKKNSKQGFGSMWKRP